jgi:hypothetical protein
MPDRAREWFLLALLAKSHATARSAATTSQVPGCRPRAKLEYTLAGAAQGGREVRPAIVADLPERVARDTEIDAVYHAPTEGNLVRPEFPLASALAQFHCAIAQQ